MKPGPKYVSGHFEGGRLVLVREDGSVEPQPVIIVKNTVFIDNDDLTCNIEFIEE